MSSERFPDPLALEGVRRAGLERIEALDRRRRAPVDRMAGRVDHAAEESSPDRHAPHLRTTDDFIAATDALKLAERHEKRDVLPEANDFARDGRAPGDAEIADRADRQRESLRFDDESDRLPHATADADGFEVGQELGTSGEAHPSSPRSI